MKLAHIVAIDQKGGIGKDNKLLGHFPEDLKRFKAATNGHIVIMGYNTWLSLPFKPLPNRLNIVIAPRDKHEDHHLTAFFDNLDSAISFAEDQVLLGEFPETVFIMGGAMLYKTTVDIADEYWITEIQKDFEADAFYPRDLLFEKGAKPLAISDCDIFEESDGTKMMFFKFTK